MSVRHWLILGVIVFGGILQSICSCGPDSIDHFTAGRVDAGPQQAPVVVPDPNEQPTYNGGPSGPIIQTSEPLADPCTSAECYPESDPLNRRFVVDPVEQRALREKHNK